MVSSCAASRPKSSPLEHKHSNLKCIFAFQAHNKNCLFEHIGLMSSKSAVVNAMHAISVCCVTLKAKLKACVGKYRMTLARLPLQNEAKPCSAVTRVKQFTIPVYLGISPATRSKKCVVSHCNNT